MMEFVNKKNIVFAKLLMPNETYYSSSDTNYGWRLILKFVDRTDTFVEKDTKEECVKLAKELGLFLI